MRRKTRILLTEIQKNFPLVPEPYKELAQRCKISEEEVFEALTDLKNKGILRQISAIFNPQALGYQTTLVAASTPKKEIEQAARIINAYPGVSHNYLRDHYYNLWFTIAVPPGHMLKETIQKLLNRAGIDEFLILPVKKIFRIALILNFGEENEDSDQEIQLITKKIATPDKKTISLVRLTQEDLPLVARPFGILGEKISLSEEEILNWIKQGLKSGLIRRFAGLIKHTKAGFRGNVMVAWQVPEQRVEEVGKKLAGEHGITHCYERRSYMHWPYNLYTMLHAKDHEEALSLIRTLAPKYNLSKYLPLFTIKELKKIRLKLFWT